MVNLSTITTKKKSGPVLIGILSTRYIADHLAFAFAAIIDIIKPDIIYRALVLLAPCGRAGDLSLADVVDTLAPKRNNQRSPLRIERCEIIMHHPYRSGTEAKGCLSRVQKRS